MLTKKPDNNAPAPTYDAISKPQNQSLTLEYANYTYQIGGCSPGGIWAGLLPEVRADDKSFVIFVPTDHDKNKEESNWKIHISVNPGDLAKAWDLIYNDLFHECNSKFKI